MTDGNTSIEQGGFEHDHKSATKMAIQGAKRFIIVLVPLCFFLMDNKGASNGVNLERWERDCEYACSSSTQFHG